MIAMLIAAWRALFVTFVVAVLGKLMFYVCWGVCAMCLLMSQDGKSPLLFASVGGQVEVVSALLGAGASVNHADQVFME